jgi:hypothetical protein
MVFGNDNNRSNNGNRQPNDKGQAVANNDNRQTNDKGQAVAPAAKGGALITPESLAAMFSGVEAVPVGFSDYVMLLFHARRSDGAWALGPKEIVQELGTKIAINPTTFGRGFIAFDRANKPQEIMATIPAPMPDRATLPPSEGTWKEQWQVGVKILSGPDAGTDAMFKGSIKGGLDCIKGLFNLSRARVLAGKHDGKVVPIGTLERGGYPHGQYGWVPTPEMAIVDWIAFDAPDPVEAPSPPSGPSPSPSAAEPPRKRRVVG